MPTRLLFLDRDGTLNRSIDERPPNAPEEVSLYPDVGAVLVPLVAEGWQPVIVTNQGGVASGYITAERAEAIQQRVIDLLPVSIAAAYLCPHLPGASVARYDLDCPNRKPRPGFVLQALHRFNAQPEDCLFVGDSSTDREAARAAQVPFQWADRFFGRPIDRGIRAEDGHWYGIRQVSAEDEPLHLVAVEGDKQAGSLTLSIGGASEGAEEGAIDLSVHAPQRRAEMALALVETALEWARARRS